MSLVRKHGANIVNNWSIERRHEWLDLTDADLTEADLSGAIFGLRYAPQAAVFSGMGRFMPIARLEGANFQGSRLGSASFRNCSLTDVNLRGADLHGADFTSAGLHRTKLHDATSWDTSWCNLDLSEALGVDSIRHAAPSEVGIQTLTKSQGKIPDRFLIGCGLPKWQIELQRLFDPTLSSNAISNHLTENIFVSRTDGPLYIGGVFISYSQNDSSFAEKLEKHLQASGVPVWRDVHKLIAGPLERQIFDAIRVQDSVVLLLSKNSIESDWVEAELDFARRREKDEKRDVLCPVALDDSWKSKSKDNVLWRTLRSKNILDFSAWKTKAFTTAFEKLLLGLKRYYPPR